MSSQSAAEKPASEDVASPRKATYTVVMVRHGQSESNAHVPHRYSGWDNPSLTEEGIQQAKRAGIALRNAGFKFDVAYTSLLTRAQETLNHILAELGQKDIPQYRTWRLNERHCGVFDGMTKGQVIEKYGENAVKAFVTPPPLTENHPHYEAIYKNITRYEEAPAPEEFPQSECLQQTIDRTIHYWHGVIVPQILKGKRVLISSHGATLMGLAMYFENMSEADLDTFRIPNAMPFLYEFDENFKPIVSRKYLNDPNQII